MPSNARFATFVRLRVRAVRTVLGLLVPAAAALSLVLAAQPAETGAAPVTAGDIAVTGATAQDGGDGFSWG
ncbi:MULTISPECIES: hypothetical protein [unclassified Streptomyces]|uniref:hypothetical protein n=1 Tax=unclassified Streptomyces TaxID=2593676 RepID=UPI0006AFD4F8|nr:MULTISPECIES: hypothetical protein [unclassified Streptomyces]KOX27670.1 hypothetical protein ADL06_14310 [Streptomyces sp. NRRL F-6491]KOX49484.1 hypothetical protein ADL08_08680 [Streptomyces sp. NRRL F-6492]